MKIRQIRRVIWLTCSDFTRKVDLRACTYRELAKTCDKRHRQALISGNKYLADFNMNKAGYYDAKSNHYKNYLRTH